MDNFNWGVRRPSLSRLEGTEEAGEASSSSAMTSLSDVTPVLPKREPRAGVGAEESSDDEMGSVRTNFIMYYLTEKSKLSELQFDEKKCNF